MENEEPEIKSKQASKRGRTLMGTVVAKIGLVGGGGGICTYIEF